MLVSQLSICTNPWEEVWTPVKDWLIFYYFLLFYLKLSKKKNPKLQTTKLSIKSKKGWLTWPFGAVPIFRSNLLSLHWFTFLRRQSDSSEIHLNWGLHHGQLCIVGRKWASSIKWFISLQVVHPESIALVVPLSVIAQRVQLVLGRLPADLSFFSALGFSFWLMKLHVSIISLASVRGCLLQPPPYDNLLCISFDLWLKHATPSSQKKHLFPSLICILMIWWGE